MPNPLTFLQGLFSSASDAVDKKYTKAKNKWNTIPFDEKNPHWNQHYQTENKYRASIKLDQNTFDSSIQSLQQFADKRTNTFNKLFDTSAAGSKEPYKLANGKTINEQINAVEMEREEPSHLKGAIDTILAKNNSAKKEDGSSAMDGPIDAVAKNAITELKALNAILAETGKYNLAHFTHQAQLIKNTALDEIKKLQAEELKSLKEAVNSAEFKSYYGPELVVTPDKHDEIGNGFVQQLEERHKTDLDKFAKSIDADVSKLETVYEAERIRLHVLHVTAANNSATRKELAELEKKEIDRLIALKTQGQGPNQGQLNPGLRDEVESKARANINPTDLTTNRTERSVAIAYDEATKTMTVNLPIFDFIHKVWGNDSTTESHLISMAMQMKAKGVEKLNVDLTYPDEGNGQDKDSHEEKALEVVRNAYRAAVKAGFDISEKSDPEDAKKNISDVKIKLNGKEISLDLAFRGHSAERQQLDGLAKQLEGQRKHAQSVNLSTSSDFKADYAKQKDLVVQKDREAAEAAQNAAPAGP